MLICRTLGKYPSSINSGTCEELSVLCLLCRKPRRSMENGNLKIVPLLHKLNGNAAW